jgi:hypothetical protein
MPFIYHFHATKQVRDGMAHCDSTIECRQPLNTSALFNEARDAIAAKVDKSIAHLHPVPGGAVVVTSLTLLNPPPPDTTVKDALIDQLNDAAERQASWVRQAKADAGYDNNTSFDVVWEETLAKAKAASN